MPFYDDDEPSGVPAAPGRPARPSSPPPPPGPGPEPYTPDGLARGRRRLIPLASLRGWTPDPAVIEAALAGSRPPGYREVPHG